MEERTAETTAGGARLSWRELGTGEPLLLLNGYAGAKADWDPIFLEHLGSHSRVICTDNRGIGDSELGDEEITVELLAADVLAVMDAIGIERASVAGWSMGGFVAQTLAASSGERVEALVLLSTDPGGENSTSTTREHFLRLIDRSGTPREQASRLISLLFPDPPAAAIDEQFGELVAAAQAALDPAALEAQVALMAAWHTAAERRAARCDHGAGAGRARRRGRRHPGRQLGDDRGADPGRVEGDLSRRRPCLHGDEPVRLAALIGTFLGR